MFFRLRKNCFNYKAFSRSKNLIQKTRVCMNSSIHNASKPKEIEPGFLEMVQTYFDLSAKHLEIPKYYLDIIKNCKAAVRFNFPLVRDDGKIQVITAYRAQHSHHNLPTKGGTRFADHIGINLFI